MALLSLSTYNSNDQLADMQATNSHLSKLINWDYYDWLFLPNIEKVIPKGTEFDSQKQSILLIRTFIALIVLSIAKKLYELNKLHVRHFERITSTEGNNEEFLTNYLKLAKDTSFLHRVKIELLQRPDWLAAFNIELSEIEFIKDIEQTEFERLFISFINTIQGGFIAQDRAINKLISLFFGIKANTKYGKINDDLFDEISKELKAKSIHRLKKDTSVETPGEIYRLETMEVKRGAHEDNPNRTFRH